MYNRCSVPAFVPDPDLDPGKGLQIGLTYAKYCIENPLDCALTGTNWHFAHTFYGVVALLMFFNFIFMLLFHARKLEGLMTITNIINFILGILHLAAWIVLLAARYSPIGENCATNIIGN